MSSLVLLLCCCLVSVLSALNVGATTKPPAPRTPALKGDPISPVVDVREKTFVRKILDSVAQPHLEIMDYQEAHACAEVAVLVAILTTVRARRL